MIVWVRNSTMRSNKSALAWNYTMCLTALQMAYEYFSIQLIHKTKGKYDTVKGRIVDDVACCLFIVIFARSTGIYYKSAQVLCVHSS